MEGDWGGGGWMRRKARLAAWLLALDLAALCQGNADRQARLSKRMSGSLQNAGPCEAGQRSCAHAPSATLTPRDAGVQRGRVSQALYG